MSLNHLREECPNVRKLIQMCSDAVTASIIENVLIGDLSMEWNGGEPRFALTEQGKRRCGAMLKRNESCDHE